MSLAVQRYSDLILDAARVRIRKRQAVLAEDFVEAGRLKRREAELDGELRQAAQAACEGNPDERKRLEEAKRKAVASEDFIEAGRLKKRLRELDEEPEPDRRRLELRAWTAALHAAEQQGAVNDGPELVGELRACAPGGVLADGGKVKVEATVKVEAPSEAAGAGKDAVACAVAAEVSPRSAGECAVPEVKVEQLLVMSNQDIWQHAWNVTWQEEDAGGRAGDEAQVYAKAKKAWKSWMAERDRLSKNRAPGDAKRQPQATRVKEEPPDTSLRVMVEPSATVPSKADAASVASKPGAQSVRPSQAAQDSVASSGLTHGQLRAQNEEWRKNTLARSEWQKVQAELNRKQARIDAPQTGKDLCAVMKQRCPADQPLQFERLLAVCPLGTTVRQLVVAMGKEPREFRQSWDGSEYCVRPVNSRCVDWLPVQATTTPPGFSDDSSLPAGMLTTAKSVFEERIKPQAQGQDDPLAIFLSREGLVTWDTPMRFAELLTRCPPGTQPTDLVRTMSKRRDLFRQDATGKLFCVKPRTRCADWTAVNPYLDPNKS